MSNNTLKFRIDVSAFRLLGRELITDRITAIFELVKNCYDANAENINLTFSVNNKNEISSIQIEDDGHGMSYIDLKNSWMVIGTGHKRRNRRSPEPYNRIMTGKKGVGRFAVDKLGSKLVLKTTQKGSKEQHCIETDWSKYEEYAKDSLRSDISFEKEGGLKLFSDIENEYWIEDVPDWKTGTILDIQNLNDEWLKKDVKRSYKELSKLILPDSPSSYPFRIVLNLENDDDYNKKHVQSKKIEISSKEVFLNFDSKSNIQETLALDGDNLIKKDTQIKKCGPVKIRILYFDQKAKKHFKRAYPDDSIDGIKIYRDGVITTPFAEHEDHRDKQRDVLGLDKRRYSGFFDRIGTRDVLGWVEITDEGNPGITDSTNRQDFDDTAEWRELKLFIIEQISKIEEWIKKKKELEKEGTEVGQAKIREDFNEIRKNLQNLKGHTKSDEFDEVLDVIEKNVAKAQVNSNRAAKKYRELEKDKNRQEDLFFSLVSLQTYAGMVSHITRTTIGRIKRNAEFLHKWIPEPKFNEQYQRFSGQIVAEMNSLSTAINFLLRYAQDDQHIEKLSAKELLENLLHTVYADIFSHNSVKVEFIADKDIVINYNRKSFEDIFDNLIGNSLKAFADNQIDRKINVQMKSDDLQLRIDFSDNGIGIPVDNKDRLFDVFFTTTADKGGAGLGLYIVKSRLEALEGKIELIKSLFYPRGATFRISIPFRRTHEQLNYRNY